MSVRGFAALLASFVGFVALACTSPSTPPTSAPPPAKPPGDSSPPRVETPEDVGPITSPLGTGLVVMDVGGGVHRIGTAAGRITVLVFISSDDGLPPLELPDLSPFHWDKGAPVYLVLTDPKLTRAAANVLAKKRPVEFPVVFDASGELAARFRPTRTPAIFVVGPGSVDAVPPPASTVIHAFAPWPKGALPKNVTYTRDIAPIVGMHCATCHRPGAVAPFSLLTYGDIAKRAKMVAQVTKRRYMPPWHAEPGFGHFRDERRLTDREIALIEAWAEQGAKEGSPDDLPPAREFPQGWELGEPDMIVEMPEAFEVPARGPDVFRCFCLDAVFPEDKYVVAVDFKPGAPTVLHHSVMCLDTTGTARKKQARARGVGFPVFGGPGFTPAGGLGGFLPGTKPVFLPEGMARLIPKGAEIVLETHYHPSGKVEQDRSKIGLYFAKKPPTHIIRDVFLDNPNIGIPPGEARYKRTIGLEVPKDLLVIGVTPHMHYLGREMKAVATSPSGETRPLVWVKDWDFRWQDQYKYDEPFVLAAGTKISVEAWFDNSPANPANPNSPPKRVKLGTQTTDEMCECRFEIALPLLPGGAGGPEEMELMKALRDKIVAPAD